MKADDFTLYNNADYFRQLLHDITAAKWGDRILVASMTYNVLDPLVAELMGLLKAAAQRGIDVHLLVDARTFLTRQSNVPGPLWFNPALERSLPPPFRENYESLKSLKQSGGHFTITNLPGKPFTNTSAGRSHIKTAIINDQVYVGGCNLQDASFTDIMVKFTDRHTAGWLYKHMLTIARTGSTQKAFQGHDQTFDINASTQLFLDAGKPNQSIILENAYDLIDTAQDWIYLTCQFFPGGKTAQHLLAAHKRGVSVQIVYAHPSIHGLLGPAHQLYTLRERMRMPVSFFTGRLAKTAPTLHAKVLATEQGVIVGSHNYVTAGVSFGTAEIAMRFTNPEFSQKLKDFIQSEIKPQ